jgi:arabinogalactan oligomer / maltooligosaccharide transport system permease protein
MNEKIVSRKKIPKVKKSFWSNIKKHKTAYFFILPSILIVIAISLGPVLYGMALSFTNYNIYTVGDISVQNEYKKDIALKEQEIKNEKDASAKADLQAQLDSYKSDQITLIDETHLDTLKKSYNDYKEQNNTAAMAKVQDQINNVKNMESQGKLFSPIRFVGLDNFAKALQGNSDFVKATLLTFLFTVICLFFQVTLGVFVAILINRKTMHFKKALRGLLILPWIMPQLVSCLVWKAMFNSEFGFVNFILARVASIFTPNANVSINWLQSSTLAFVVICIVNIWIGIPFITMSTTSALQSIPEDLYEAATLDGCNRYQSLWYITIPFLRSALVPAILMGTIWTFTCFNVPYFITQIGSNQPVYLVSNFMFKQMRDGTYNMASAYGIIVFLILLVITLMNIKVTKTLEEV